jgi:hypothetical protein
VPARRITIPIVITQVRPGNFYFWDGCPLD